MKPKDKNKNAEEINDTKAPEAPQEKTKLSKEEESFKEQFLRLSADLQNYKRRVEKERLDWMHMAQSNILQDILPIFDELNRALELSEQEATDEKTKKWLEGFKLIQKNWTKKISDLGVKEIDASGEFNPELHEALMQADSKDVESNHIVQCFEKGYTFKDKVIRHAKVSVAK